MTHASGRGSADHPQIGQDIESCPPAPRSARSRMGPRCIEVNVLVTADGHRNLTREALPE